MTSLDTLGWLVRVEASMAVHERTYPGDGHWRWWIRTQAMTLDDAWYARLQRHAEAVLDGRADRFIDPGDLS